METNYTVNCRYFCLSFRLIYYATEPYMVIVFEDLSKYGYKMTPTLLNFEQAKPAYAKLAQFHATSIFMNDEVCTKIIFVCRKCCNALLSHLLLLYVSVEGTH